MKNYILLIVISGLLLTTGCARTVTTKTTGNQIVFNITFNGSVDATVNRYYIVLATVPTVVPYASAIAKEYFFAPGEIYNQDNFGVNTLEAYYDNYFSHWMDFVTLQNNTFYITNGNFTSFEAHNSYFSKRVFVSSKDSTLSKQLTFTLFFTYLSQTPAKLYFNILSVDSNGYLRDSLDQADSSFSTNTGTVVTVSDPVHPDVVPGLDILNCQIAVQ